MYHQLGLEFPEPLNETGQGGEHAPSSRAKSLVPPGQACGPSPQMKAVDEAGKREAAVGSVDMEKAGKDAKRMKIRQSTSGMVQKSLCAQARDFPC